jgi:hypothetical protein
MGMAKILDRNAFNFQEHIAREGLIDENGKPRISDELKAKWERDHKCATVTLTRKSDGATISVNAGNNDDIAEWAKQGFLPPPGPPIADPLKENERLKAELAATNAKLDALIAGLEAKKGK